MSNFTTKPPHPASVISLNETGEDQVAIMVSAPDGQSYRVAAFSHGKLHLFRFNTVIADEIGLKLDSEQYPVIHHAGA